MSINDLDKMAEKVRVDRVEYTLYLENLLTLKQLDNGAIIRYK